MQRNDDFEARRQHLKGLTDEELKARFWQLANELVDPLVALGRENTSPAIERSVLLRMGFSSLEAKAIADGCAENALLAHGAGNVVYRFAKAKDLPIRDAGLLLAAGKSWQEAATLFTGGAN